MTPTALVLDLAVLVAVGIAVVRGWNHGSIREFFGLLGLGVGLLVAPFLTGPLARALGFVLDGDLNVSRGVALGVIVGLSALTGAVVGVRTARGVTLRGPAKFDAMGGSMFAFVRVITVAALVLFAALVLAPEAGEDSLASAISDSASGQLLAEADSPFSIFFDSVIARSEDLQALTLWAAQRSGFDEEIPGERLAFAATTDQLTPARRAEKEMLRLLNRERVDRGLDPLAWCEECAEVARGHSRDMYRHGYFSHIDSRGDDPFDRMTQSGIVYGAAGENLSIAPTVERAHVGLMDSTDHRENILRSLFDEVGIGCYEGPYGFMCTEVFRALV